MGGQMRVYRQRIRSVSATKKITKAMELIAASRVVKAREAVGQPIVDSIKGGDLSASVETAQKAFQAVLDAEKK